MIVDPKSALLLQPEEAWRKIFKQALEENGFKVTEVKTALEALTTAAEHYHRVFVLDSTAAIDSERELGGRGGATRLPVLTWVEHLSPIEEEQLLILTGPPTDKILVPMKKHWPASTGWIDRSEGVSNVRARLQKLIAAPSDPSWRSPDAQQAAVRVAVAGTIMGMSETGIAVRAPLFAPRPIPGFQCVTELFKTIGVKMPHAFLAESERLPEIKSADQMPQATLRFQIVGWNETERARLRSWLTQNRLKVVEP